MILTNGVYLSDYDYAKQFADIPNLFWTFGLNHPDYQGHTVRKKQMEGIDNCMKLSMTIKNVSYTLETIDQLEYCLEEIQEFGQTLSPHNYRDASGQGVRHSHGGDV